MDSEDEDSSDDNDDETLNQLRLNEGYNDANVISDHDPNNDDEDEVASDDDTDNDSILEPISDDDDVISASTDNDTVVSNSRNPTTDTSISNDVSITSSVNSDTHPFNMNVADIEDVDGNIEIVFEDDNNKTPYPDDEINQPDSNLDTDEFSEVINKQGRRRRTNAGAGVTRLEVGFGTKKYASIQSKQLLCRNINSNQHRFLLHKAMGIILTQMSANEGFRRLGQRSVAAMIKELK